LNALFNGVDKNMFRLIKQCIVAKDYWEILKTAHEGTTKVKSARLQLLTTKFENLKMMEEENIHDNHLNILDIVNTFDSLGEKMSEEKVVRKILRSLPKRFDMKVIVIEEAHDISSLKVDELIVHLKILKSISTVNFDKNRKGTVCISGIGTEETPRDLRDNGSLSEVIILFGRQFNKILKQTDWKSRSNGHNIRLNIDTQQDNMRKVKTDDNNNQSKGVQCH